MSVSQKYGVRSGGLAFPFMISCEDILSAVEEAQLIFVAKTLVLDENNNIVKVSAPVEDVTYSEIVELGNHRLTIIGQEESEILKSDIRSLAIFGDMLNSQFKVEKFSTTEFAIYKR